MEQKIDSYCVKVDANNIKEIKNWFKNDTSDFSIGNYYGIGKYGGKDGYMYWVDPLTYFNRLISTEEFYQKIGIGNNILLKLEIY